MWILFLATLNAAETEGYAEIRASYVGGVEGTPWQVVERFRPTLSSEIGKKWALEATVEVIGAHGRWEPDVAFDLVDEQIGSVLESASCPFEKPARRIEGIDDVLGVERFFVDYFGEKVDVRVGRQALNWGSAQMLNPTDLFSEVLVAEPWRERKGVNAARLNWAWKNGGQLTAVAAVNDRLDEGRFGVKPMWSVAETDIAPVLSVTTEGTPFMGLDLRGQQTVGWWLEGGAGLSEDEWLPELSVGMDYSFVLRDGLIFGLQYTYDGTGIADPFDYTLAARGTVLVPIPSCDAAKESFSVPENAEPRFTIGQHYALAWTNLAWDENWSFQASALMNLQDRSSLVIPTLSWLPGDRLSLHAGAQLLLGEGEFSPSVYVSRVDFGEGQGNLTVDFDGVIPSWAAFSYLRFAL